MCRLKMKWRDPATRFMKKAAGFDPYEIEKYRELAALLQKEHTKVCPVRFGLRLLLISDTHGYLALDRYRLPEFLDTVGEFDLCILLGDLHPAEMPVILDCIPKEKIVGIRGNHDSFSIYSDYGVRDISGQVFTYRGVRFAGIDGSFRYKDEEFPSHTQYESLVLARALPEADVLLSHDVMLQDCFGGSAHAGLIGIAWYIYKNRVQWHFHGHIHIPYEHTYPNGTREKSVYLCQCMEV